MYRFRTSLLKDTRSFIIVLILLVVFASLRYVSVDSGDILVEDVDILMRNQIFRSQLEQRQRYNSNPKRAVNFYYAFTEVVDCVTRVRVGSAGNGGKWVCNPWRLGPSRCVVYSLGVGGEISFEKQLDQMVQHACEIHSFDPQPYGRLFNGSTNLVFHPWLFAENTDATNMKFGVTLADAMNELGHDYVDILKVDIESGEYGVLPPALAAARAGTPWFCQLLIEMHPFADHNTMSTEWFRLMLDVEASGYLLFMREPNLRCAGCAIEYSFIHRSCLVRFGLHGQQFSSNLSPLRATFQ